MFSNSLLPNWFFLKNVFSLCVLLDSFYCQVFKITDFFFYNVYFVIKLT